MSIYVHILNNKLYYGKHTEDICKESQTSLHKVEEEDKKKKGRLLTLKARDASTENKDHCCKKTSLLEVDKTREEEAGGSAWSRKAPWVAAMRISWCGNWACARAVQDYD